jgi:NAD+ kinase
VPEPSLVRRVGLVVHRGRPGAVDAARSLAGWLSGHAVATRTLQEEADDGRTEALGDEEAPEGSFTDQLDLVVSVGGDGTLLRAALLAGPAGLPLLGMKVGRVGFLTEVEPGEANDLLGQILEGKMVVEERPAIVAHPIGAPWTEPQWALNEVIVEKTARHRLITIATTVGGEAVTTFAADGVIVATPTGSTAYSFSARGPIVSPRVDCLLLTPVSPHMVFDRSIVLSPEDGVTLEVQGDEPGVLSADGRPGMEMPVGSRVRIEQAERPLKLVRREGSPSFWALLGEKFGLPGEAPHVLRPLALDGE